MKGKVYVNNPKTIEQLKDEIWSVIEGIELQLCENVTENLDKRMTICGKSHGGHLSDVIFDL